MVQTLQNIGLVYEHSFFTNIKSDAWFLPMALLSEFLKICILILVLVLLCYSQLVCEGIQTAKQSQKAEGC